MPTNPSHLKTCLSLIEKELGWGNSQDWKASDFELLSEKIFSKTGVNLSRSTLKRLWGKVKYDSEPQISTLNTLARFLDFENFRDFTNSLTQENSIDFSNEENLNTEKVSNNKEKSLWSNFTFLGIGLVIIAMLGWTFLNQNSPKRHTPDDFSFSSQPVTSGIPNSVVFEFDVSKALTDSLFIQQSWDSGKRIRIEKTQHKATSIYYYPGFYKAKLVLGNEIIREHDLIIPSDGWLGLVVKEPVPVYFEKISFVKDGRISISESDLNKENIPLTPELPITSFYYVKDFEGFSTDKFSLETRFRNTYSKGSGACQFSQLVILTTTTPYVFSFSIPGCTSDLNIMLSEKMIDGTKNDLSGLGINFPEWGDFRVEVENKNVKLFLGSNQVFQESYVDDAGEIVGVGIHFQGTGEVDFLRLFDESGKSVLSEDF